MPEEYMTLKDVAELLKLSEKTTYRLAQSGRLPGFKAGGQWRFLDAGAEASRGFRLTGLSAARQRT